MQYSKIEDGRLINAPRNLKTENGMIFNYNLNREMMLADGFKPVKLIKPDFDKESQIITISRYEESEEYILIYYEAIDNTKSVIDRIESLEDCSIEILATTFDLDFRIFEIEATLDIPTQINIKGANNNMALSIYIQAQTLILAGKYDREDMEYKLKRYLDRNRITKAEYDELISMMAAQEVVK